MSTIYTALASSDRRTFRIRRNAAMHDSDRLYVYDEVGADENAEVSYAVMITDVTILVIAHQMSLPLSVLNQGRINCIQSATSSIHATSRRHVP
jgi:hypothetical protein